jgi:hypothetical protein
MKLILIQSKGNKMDSQEHKLLALYNAFYLKQADACHIYNGNRFTLHFNDGAIRCDFRCSQKFADVAAKLIFTN